MRAPLACRALLRAASWLVPARARSAWLASRSAELFDWWCLVERGEPVGGEGVALCRRAVADAWSERFGGSDPRHWFRGPMFVPIGAAASLLVLALASHGFAVTRHLAEIARDVQGRAVNGYDARGDRLAVYIGPIFLALATGLSVLAAGCFTLRGRGWRYWTFLFFKALAFMVLLPLIWVELGTTLRHQFASVTGRILTGLFTAVALIVAMGRAMIWCVADQRRRCRACFRRMILPVSVGSWGSLFEPSTTEMLCEEGHGALALSDAETDVSDRWTRLDDSWKTLFR
jgi:hypothetical protein